MGHIISDIVIHLPRPSLLSVIQWPRVDPPVTWKHAVTQWPKVDPPDLETGCDLVTEGRPASDLETGRDPVTEGRPTWPGNRLSRMTSPSVS